MYKLFAFVGSPRLKQSCTLIYTQKLFDCIKGKLDDDVTYSIYTLNDVKIEQCKGCLSCFGKTEHCINRSDDMMKLEQEMINSDLILFGSPVYMHNISGGMKTFIDRISYWSHILKLIGKLGVTLSTATSNGNLFVNSYLQKIMIYMGMSVAANMSFTYYSNCDSNETKNQFRQDIDTICSQLTNVGCRNITDQHEQIYQFFKKTYSELEHVNPQHYEYRYWKENGYFNYNNFKDLYISKYRGD